MEYLIHHGIKGQKWGVRRSKEQLLHDPYSIAAKVNNRKLGVETLDGHVTAKMSKHAIERLSEPERNRLTAEWILDALKRPLDKELFRRYNKDNKPSQRFIGKYATVNINTLDGTIPTVHPTHSSKAKKLERRNNGK